MAEIARPLRIGWIGTGIMGSSMAGHLLRAGHAVRVHSRTRSKAQPLLDAGAEWAESPAEAARGVDVVCSNVGMPSEVEEVYYGSSGALRSIAPGQVLVDFGTSPPSFARRLAASASEHGAAAVDAPVSGGDIGARNATLSIMVGGAEGAVSRVRPILGRLGKSVVHMGPSGAGQRTKLVNQVLVAANTLGMCEALHLADRAGLDLQRVLDAVGGGAAASWSLQVLAPRVLKGDLDPGFLVEHLVKDLRIARDEAKELGEVVPLIDLCLARYEALVAAGHGRKGTQGVVLLYRDR
jgi:3-hydroxyisobutyrate dehydrogenase